MCWLFDRQEGDGLKKVLATQPLSFLHPVFAASTSDGCVLDPCRVLVALCCLANRTSFVAHPATTINHPIELDFGLAQAFGFTAQTREHDCRCAFSELSAGLAPPCQAGLGSIRYLTLNSAHTSATQVLSRLDTRNGPDKETG